MTRRLHQFEELPPGKAVAEVLPAFANVKWTIHIGEPSKRCAGCWKPFSPVRKARRILKAYPIGAAVPIAVVFRLCGTCVAAHQAGWAARDAVLAAVEAFFDGEGATQ